mgnify:CR=1 FL=1
MITRITVTIIHDQPDPKAMDSVRLYFRKIVESYIKNCRISIVSEN